MVARPIIVPGAMPARDANGRALPSLLRFYSPGTTTPKAVYTSSALTAAHEFPVVSDSAGRWPAIWADESQSFNVGWSDQALDQTIATYENLSPAADAVLSSVAQAEAFADAAETAQTAAEAAAAEAEAAVADLGDLSGSVTAAEASATAASASAAAAAASAAEAAQHNPELAVTSVAGLGPGDVSAAGLKTALSISSADLTDGAALRAQSIAFAVAL